ncbi:TolB family protein [Hyphococcus lacteus]|uniref:S9 family peptidase n=1 Tax=Hyphococcus lacteus TaxID=3143536 RepID=A0ABV3Z9S3_9PROT
MTELKTCQDKRRTRQSSRLHAIVLAAFIATSLAACGSGGDHTTTVQPPPPPPSSRSAETIIFSGKEDDAATSPEAIFIGQDDEQIQERIADGVSPGNEVVKFQTSPDGQWIAYIIKFPTRGTEQVVRPVSGGSATILNARLKSPVDLFSTDIGEFAWSTASQQVASTAVFTTRRDRERFYLINRDDSDLRNLNEGQTETQPYGNPQFSPDGRYIVQKVRASSIAMLPPLPFALQFTDLTQSIPNNITLTAANGALTNVRWSPISTSLCFALHNSTTDPDAYNIRVSDVSITAPNTFISAEGDNAESECRSTPNGAMLT